MQSDSIGRRLMQVGALLLIGNGVMGLVRPRWHALPWRFGPQLARAVTEELADHPKAGRPVYLAQAALGLLLARQNSDA
jgi:hypothetical protein